MKRTVPNRMLFAETRDRLLAGREVVVRVLGQSMLPFFRSGSRITLRPLREGDLRRGHVVLGETDNGHFVVHRILSLRRARDPAGRRQHRRDRDDTPRANLRHRRLRTAAPLAGRTVDAPPPAAPLSAGDPAPHLPQIKSGTDCRPRFSLTLRRRTSDPTPAGGQASVSGRRARAAARIFARPPGATYIHRTSGRS